MKAKADAIAQYVMLLIDSYYRNVFDIEDMDSKVFLYFLKIILFIFNDLTKKLNYLSKKIGLKEFLTKDVENAAVTIENLINMYSPESNKDNNDKNKSFCVGNKLTYADLFVFEMIKHYFPSDEDAEFRLRFPRIYKVYEAVEAMPKITNFIKTNKDHPCQLCREF
jgi:glutathione S-transferase